MNPSKSKRLFIMLISGLCFFSLPCEMAFAQDKPWYSLKKDDKKEPLLKISVRKRGPYFGLQQGAFTFAELGGEMQWKQVKWKKPTTYALNAGALYKLTNNVFGFNAGAWRKHGRFDFTYGVNLAYRTDFQYNSFGLGPVVGYKVWGFHFLAGYDFLSQRKYFREANTLYVAARFLLVSERKSTWEWRKRENKKKKD